MERECSALGWDQVIDSPTQISSKLRQVFEQFCGYSRVVVGG